MTTKRQFGRHFSPDERDHAYRVDVGVPRRTSRYWKCDRWFDDQADEPRCVGSAWAGLLDAPPFRQWLDPQGIYTYAKVEDEFRGESYDGTTVRGAAIFLQAIGAISEYRWTWSAEEAASVVLTTGPMVVGTDWYEGMSEPNRAGLLSLDGEYQGGHAYLLCGYNSRNEMFRVKNSWGPDWGKDGFATLSLADLQRLLDADGEACIGTERRLAA